MPGDRMKAGKLHRVALSPAHAARPVQWYIVHRADVAPLQGRCQHPCAVGAEDLPRYRSLRQHRCRHPVVRQSSHQRHCLPGTERHLAHQPLARWAPSAPSCHAGRHRGFIDEYQPPGIETALLATPSPAHGGDVRTVLFGGVPDFLNSQPDMAQEAEHR